MEELKNFEGRNLTLRTKYELPTFHLHNLVAGTLPSTRQSESENNEATYCQSFKLRTNTYFYLCLPDSRFKDKGWVLDLLVNLKEKETLHGIFRRNMYPHDFHQRFRQTSISIREFDRHRFPSENSTDIDFHQRIRPS